MNDKVKKQIIALLQAALNGDQQATQALQDIMTRAKQGDKKAIALAQAIQSVVQEMQGGQTKNGQAKGTVAARLGAKLNYIRTIKGACPEGEELVYFKEGGKVCKKCMAKQGAKTVDGNKTIADFKKRKACGGTKFKQDGGNLPKEKCGGKAKKHMLGGVLGV